MTAEQETKAKRWEDPLNVQSSCDVTFEATVLESGYYGAGCRGKDRAFWGLYGVQEGQSGAQAYRILVITPPPEAPGDGKISVEPTTGERRVFVGERAFEREDLESLLRKAVEQKCHGRAVPLKVSFEPKFHPEHGQYITDFRLSFL